MHGFENCAYVTFLCTSSICRGICSSALCCIHCCLFGPDSCEAARALKTKRAMSSDVKKGGISSSKRQSSFSDSSSYPKPELNRRDNNQYILIHRPNCRWWPMHHPDNNNNTSQAASWGTYKLKTFATPASSPAVASPAASPTSPEAAPRHRCQHLFPLSARQIYQINYKKAQQAVPARNTGRKNTTMKFTKMLSNLTRAVSSGDNKTQTQKDQDQPTPTNRGRTANFVTKIAI